MRCVVLLFLLMGLLTGCTEQVPAAGPDEAAEKHDPVAAAKENSAEGAQALAVSDKGVDEEGDKVWKQEALDFYNLDKNPRSRTFEMPRKFATELTQQLYAAGADKVWVTRISETEIGDQKINISDDLLIVLPTDPAKRKAVFKAYNDKMEDEEQKYPDVGQQYIHLVAD